VRGAAAARDLRNIEESAGIDAAVRTSAAGRACGGVREPRSMLRRRCARAAAARRATRTMAPAPHACTRTGANTDAGTNAAAANGEAARGTRRQADDWGRHRRKSREALRVPPPRRPRVTKPARAPRLGRYPGWRRTGSPSRANERAVARACVHCTRNAPEPACIERCGRLPLRGQRR
jgi:hypothetical protein